MEDERIPNKENYIDDDARRRIHEILDKVIDVRNEVGGYMEFILHTIESEMHVFAKPGELGDEECFELCDFFNAEELGKMRKQRIINELEAYRRRMIRKGKIRGEVI